MIQREKSKRGLPSTTKKRREWSHSARLDLSWFEKRNVAILLHAILLLLNLYLLIVFRPARATNPSASAPPLPFVDRTAGAKKVILMLMWWLEFNLLFFINIETPLFLVIV